MQDVRAANVKALTDGALLALHRDDFNTLLGSLTHIRHMWRFEALRKVSTLLRISCSTMIHEPPIAGNFCQARLIEAHKTPISRGRLSGLRCKDRMLIRAARTALAICPAPRCPRQAQHTCRLRARCRCSHPCRPHRSRSCAQRCGRCVSRPAPPSCALATPATPSTWWRPAPALCTAPKGRSAAASASTNHGCIVPRSDLRVGS